MPVIVFGHDEANPVTAAETAAISRFSGEVSSLLLSIGLFRIENCFNNSDALIRFFTAHSAFGAQAILHLDARVAQYALATEGAPTAADVLAYLESDLNTTFTWNNANNAAQLAIDKNRVAGRLMMLLIEAIRFVRRPDVTDAGDDDRLLSIQNESCAQANKRIYGFSFFPSQMPTTNILGKFYRGYSTGTFPVVSVDKIFAQNEQAANEKYQFDAASNTFAKKRPNARIGNPSDFMHKLEIRCNGLAFVGCVFIVDDATWSGCTAVAKVGTSYCQYTRRDSEKYLEAWRPYVSKFANNIDFLVRLEYKIMKQVPDMMADKVRLGQAQMDAFAMFRGEIATYQPRSNPNPNPSPRAPKAPRAGPNGGDPPKAPESPYAIARRNPDFNERARTAEKNENGELLCKRHNDRRDGDCKYGNNCKFKHQCDVLVDGKACGSTTHCRKTHPF